MTNPPDFVALIRATIEAVLALVVVISPLYAIWFAKNRRDKNGKPMGMGVRLIQLLTVAITVPAILILAIERVIDGAVVGTLLGGLIGYVLSNMSDYKPASSRNRGSNPDPSPEPENEPEQ